MGEDTKFIVTEINKLLSRSYNLISFSALGPDDLLQVRNKIQNYSISILVATL